MFTYLKNCGYPENLLKSTLEHTIKNIQNYDTNDNEPQHNPKQTLHSIHPTSKKTLQFISTYNQRNPSVKNQIYMANDALKNDAHMKNVLKDSKVNA